MWSALTSPSKGPVIPAKEVWPNPTDGEIYSKVDHSTLSSLATAQTRHVHLRWTLDFDKRILSGTATHHILLLENSSSVCFDSSLLAITDVKVEGTVAEFLVADRHEVLGTKVTVILPENCRTKGKKIQVEFVYSTSPEASAIQFIEPSGTHGKRYPYVYTQCQAIHARSLLPCMDSPGIKSTYSAVVFAPSWCTVLMSALSSDLEKEDAAGCPRGMRCFRFSQGIPTPAYLIALAAGELISREISHRVKIWAEPGVCEKAAFDFSQTEDFLRAAEELTCEYAWTRYDVLCLPPSFPYGGMENPCLTFCTPTLLTGDKSLADVIAHEIAHSWTGNLVTNHTWSHFWLNEGWTMWLQRKIEQRVKGGVEHLRLSAQSGWNHLKDDVAQLTGESEKFTKLVWPLEEGADPDDAFSGIPYEKGFNLLHMLECIVGSTVFEAFAKEYIGKFKFQTVTAGEFKDCFLEFIKSHNDAKVNKAIKALDWDQLLLGTGMPLYEPDFTNSLSSASVNLGQRWLQAAKEQSGLAGARAEDIAGWSTLQKCLFLEVLSTYLKEAGADPFTDSYLRALDQSYALTTCPNAEIKFRWQDICLRCEAAWIVPHVCSFLASQGRMKYVRPLFRLLVKSRVGSKAAVETFKKHGAMYHSICRKMVVTDFEKSGVTAPEPDGAPCSANGSERAGGQFVVPILVTGALMTLGFAMARGR